MGSGSSLRRNFEEDELQYETEGNGVIRRIPVEVKPRGKLGRKSKGNSFINVNMKKQKTGSMRSALSEDFEDTAEVQRLKTEMEMLKKQNDTEKQNHKGKEIKYQKENKRLFNELRALQKLNDRLREERNAALDAQKNAHVRSNAFENDRDTIQKQFKIFRETKENEIQNLLKSKRELENKYMMLQQGMPYDGDNVSRMGLDPSIGDGNQGDWWTRIDSEPSLGSTTQLHTTGFKGPEFAQSRLEFDGPYTNVNKEDWHAVAASLAHIFPSIPLSIQSNVVRIYISAPNDMQQEREIFLEEYAPLLKKLCASEGRFLNLVHIPDKQNENNCKQTQNYIDRQKTARCNLIDQATLFLAFLGDEVARYTEIEYKFGHLDNPGNKPAVICFRQSKNKKMSDEVASIRKKVEESGNMKLIENYKTPQIGAEKAHFEIDRILQAELGVEQKKEVGEMDLESDGAESLCGGCLWDTNQDYEQLEALEFAGKSSCELGFEKYYERLNQHISSAGPLPPFLVCGPSGSGCSLLLAKWIELQQQKSTGGVVLYHFVGSEASCSADPVLMIRRLTAQLMHHGNTIPPMQCDASRLLEEFPKWLEKVSSRLPGGIILVLESLDRFQQGEHQLSWLLDPLPVDSRVIVSAHEDTCPQSWKSWPTLHLEELTNKNVKELMRAELASQGKSISIEEENRILTHCRTAGTCSPLYVVVLASDIASCSSEVAVSQRLDSLLKTNNTVELYILLLDMIKLEFESTESKGYIKKILRFILASRNGISESELFELLPSMSWLFWTPLCEVLIEKQIVTFRSGLLVFAHEQARKAVEEKYIKDPAGKHMIKARKTLMDYFSRYLGPGEVTYRIADELPWLNRQIEDLEALQKTVLNLCVFTKSFGRGRCGELISYWQFLEHDKGSMAKEYLGALKQMEEMVGQFDGLVTLPRIADVYEALGRFLRDLGLLKEAYTPLQRALEIRETALDPDHPSVAQALHQMAGLNAQDRKYSTAEALYKQAKDIYEGAFGQDHYLVAKELEALAVLYQRQGKHDLAEPLHKKALSIKKKSMGPRVASGRMRSVDPNSRRALQLDELSSQESLESARTLNEIGVLHYLQNNMEASESFFKRSLEIREAILGPDHPDLAQSLYNLGSLFNDRKQYEKAVPLYERAYKIRIKNFPPDHPSVASVVKHLAMVYKKLGKMDMAVPLHQQAIEIRERSFGPNHPSVATAMVNLAVIYSQQGNQNAAEPLYEKALKIYEETLGTAHPRVAETLRNMALLKYEQGDFETAAKFYQRSTEIKELEPSMTGKGMSRRSSTSGETASTIKNAMNSQSTFYPHPE